MLAKFYNNFLAKDRSLRHYSQHLFFAMMGLISMAAIFDLRLTGTDIFIFFLFTYIPDIDGPITLYFHKRWFPFASEIAEELKKFHLEKVALLLTKHHKKVNRPFFHNVIGLLVVLIFFSFFIVNKNELGLIIFGAVFTHFIFDILDDLHQLGHVRNWLWFI